MATIGGQEHRTVKQYMLQRPAEFNIFQLLRVLLKAPATALPIERRLRFKADLSSAFPAREFSHLSVREDHGLINNNGEHEEIIDISSANFCLASVLGPLPEPFTEWVRELLAERVPAMADFFDIFNQRINLLRFELKQAQTLALNNEGPGETKIEHNLAALMGLATSDLATQVPLAPRAWLGLAGLLANRRKNAATVEHVLSLVLQTKVTLTQFVGGWQNIEAQDTTQLGRFNQRLGVNSVVGQRVWDQQARVRIEIADLDYQSTCQLLPPAQLERIRLADKHAVKLSYFSRFVALLLLLLDGMVDCEIVIRVIANTIPCTRLIPPVSTASEWPVGIRLGQTAWLSPSKVSGMQTRSVRYLLRADASMRAA